MAIRLMVTAVAIRVRSRVLAVAPMMALTLSLEEIHPIQIQPPEEGVNMVLLVVLWQLLIQDILGRVAMVRVA